MSAVPSLPCCYADDCAPTFVEKYETTDPFYDFEYHSHADADWEIQFMACGRSTICLDDRPYELGAGEILILGPEQPHSCAASLGTRTVLTFREESLKSLPFKARPEGPGELGVEGRHLVSRLYVPPRVRPRITRILAQLHADSVAGEPMARAMCSVLLGEMLLILAREAPEASPTGEVHASLSAQQTVERFCEEIRANLDHPWTLAEMVRRSGYSAPQLNRLFAIVTSLSPCRWVRQERTLAARHLLVDTDKMMSQIALEVGFDSRCQFHRAFSQITGMTPEEYRRTTRLAAEREEASHH